MVQFILKNWWRNKSRFLLFLSGIILFSSGTGYLSGLSEQNQMTVKHTIENTWQPSYHLIVRSNNDRSLLSEDGLLEPNFLYQDASDGINLEQLEEIKSIPEVELAAPLSVIGYTSFQIVWKEINPEEWHQGDGIYRYTYKYSKDTDTKSSSHDVEYTRYTYIGPEQGSYSGFVPESSFNKIEFHEPVLLVGVDPNAEAHLVGLDEALLSEDQDRYFNEYDQVKSQSFADSSDQIFFIPVLYSDQISKNQIYSVTIEKLDFPIDQLNGIEKLGGKNFLDHLKFVGNQVTYQLRAEEIKDKYRHPYSPEGETIKLKSFMDSGRWLFKSSPPDYEPVQNPYPQNWGYAYQIRSIEPQHIRQDLSLTLLNSFRSAEQIEQNKYIVPKWIGTYSTRKLNISTDPFVQLPFDQYRPVHGKKVLDATGRPINPPVTVTGDINPLGYMSHPPGMITTLEAAREILGEDAFISSIRVKVKNISGLDENSIQKLQTVAKEIERKTGLKTDMIFGSSPQPVFIHVNNTFHPEASFWMERPMIKMGESISLFNEFKLNDGYTLIGISMVVLVYLSSIQYISYLNRRRELATLIAIGWKRTDLIKLIFIEAILIGSMMMVFAWGMAGVLMFLNHYIISGKRILFLTGLSYGSAIVSVALPALYLTGILPNEGIKSGDVNPFIGKWVRVHGLFSMSLSNFIRRIERNAFSVLAMMIPTGLIVFYYFISTHLEGTLYTSWMGSYIALETGKIQYMMLFIALLISFITTIQISWYNVILNKTEMRLLQSLGWKNKHIQFLHLLEGFYIGVVAGIVSYFIGIYLIYVIYGDLSFPNMLGMIWIPLITVFMGMVGTTIPLVTINRKPFFEGWYGQFSMQKISVRTRNVLTILLIIVISIPVYTLVVLVSQQPVAINEQNETIQLDEKNQNPSNGIKSGKEDTGDLAGFDPQYISSGSNGIYNLSLNMDETGMISINAEIDVQNISSDEWEEIVFYFIPNVFTDANKHNLGVFEPEQSASLSIEEISLNNDKVEYSLLYDTLSVHLNEKLKPGEQCKLKIRYKMTVPENGVRISKVNSDYYLAQWYPMLSTYHDGWNKEEYIPIPESYHTDFSDFVVKYNIPESYYWISSDEEEEIMQSTGSGESKVKQMKEFFAGVLKKPQWSTGQVGNTEIRVFGNDKAIIVSTLNIAMDAMKFFEDHIGEYPYRQLDILIGGSHFGGMEYPGIVSVNPGSNDYERIVVHEIAHQWFYGMISNDPYHDPWLDEGLTEFATSLFFYKTGRGNVEESFRITESMQQIRLKEPKKSNMPIAEMGEEFRTYLYEQPVIRLWELFVNNGGIDEAVPFLQAYYKNYVFKQLDTKEFIRFSKTYFKLSEDDSFDEWLDTFQ